MLYQQNAISFSESLEAISLLSLLTHSVHYRLLGDAVQYKSTLYLQIRLKSHQDWCQDRRQLVQTIKQ